MEDACWRLVLVLITRLPGVARRTVCMKPNSFQVSIPKLWCPHTARAFLLMATMHPQPREAASSLISSKYPPVPFFAALAFAQLLFLGLQPSTVLLSTEAARSDCNPGENTLSCYAAGHGAAQRGPAIWTAAAIQITSKMNVFFKGKQWHTSPVCTMANSTFLGYRFLPWQSLPHLRGLRWEVSLISGTSRRATWGNSLEKLTSMLNSSFVRGWNFHRSESRSVAVLQAHDKAF